MTATPVGLYSGTAGIADGTALPPTAPVFVPLFFASTDFEQAVPAENVGSEMRLVTHTKFRLTALNKP